MSLPNFDCTVNAECLWNHLSCVLMDLFVHLYTILANPVSVLVGNTGDAWAKTTRSFSGGCASNNPYDFRIILAEHSKSASRGTLVSPACPHIQLAWDVCRNHGVRIEMPIWRGDCTCRVGPICNYFWDAPHALLTRSIQISHSLDVAGCQVHHAFHPHPIAPFLN